ncbi:MAG TPA: hypothetical protein VGM67_12640 [Gemmatimonadaceae bacterium]|jgi:hypothetical protein
MTSSDRDPLLERAIKELERLPAVNANAVQRVIDAAATARVTPADEPADVEFGYRPRGSRAWRIAASVAAISAAAVVGFMVRGAPAPRIVSPAPTAIQMAPVADVAGAAKPVLRQFVFQNARAKRVSVVGDFNQWNPSTAPMVRSADGTLWSALIPILPGRHVYAYMVDDSVLTLDPAAETARDPDFGTNASVVLVGKP